MKQKKVVIFGNTGFAQVVHFYLSNDSPFEAAAFTVDDIYLKEKKLDGLSIVPFEIVEDQYPPDDYAMFIAIGYQKRNKLRAKKYHEAKKKGYDLISYVSSKSVIWTEDIGENCFILENQVIQPFVKIGNNIIIWSGNHIGHHSIIEDHCFITSHVVISGNVRIKSYCFLGVNSTLRDGITVASESLIGAGSLIMEDTIEKGVYKAESTKPRFSYSSK